MDLERERDELRLRVRALEEERRLGARVVGELRTNKAELEAQNHGLRDAQALLEDARARYADLYDFAPIPYFTFDKDGAVREVNLTGAMLLGRNRARLIGRPFLSLAQFSNADDFQCHLHRALEATGPVTGELSLTMGRRHADVQLVSACVRDARGEAVACRSVMIDVTQQRVAERYARVAHTSETNMRRQLELIDRASAHITAAVANLGADLRPFLQLVADQVRLIVDAEVSAIGLGGEAGEPFEPWVHSSVSREMAAAFKEAPRAVGVLGAVLHAGRALRLRDIREHVAFPSLPPRFAGVVSFLGLPIRFQGESRGSLFLANKRGAQEFTAEDQHLVEMLADRVGVALEIARLRQIERRESRRFELAARAGLAFAASLDHDATAAAIAQLLVPAAADACALDMVERSGRLRGVAVHHRDPSHREALVGARIEGEGALVELPAEAWESLQRGDVHRLTPAESLLLRGMADAAATPSAIAAPLMVRGRLTGVLTLAWAGGGQAFSDDDITIVEEIAHHAALALDAAELYRTAQSAVRSRDSLLAVVSHDLRNYLTSIRLSSKFLGREDVPRDSSALRRHVDSIARAATVMDQLIATLHDATMIEAGHFTVSMKPLDLCAVVEEARQMLEPQTEARALRFCVVKPDGGAAVVRADRARLLQVLANLVGNAVKFTANGGEIIIAVHKHDDIARLSVRDTGCGMDAELLEHVFERHWRSGGRSGAAESAGSGLGLFIVKGIVEAHGGRVDVASEPGRGTEFSFTIPLLKEDKPADIETRDEDAHGHVRSAV